MTQSEPNSPTEQVLVQILAETHWVPPTGLPDVLERYAPVLGLDKLTVYLADIQQDWLTPLTNGDGAPPQSESIDGSLAGWAYRTASLRITDQHEDGLALWVPMLDGIDRVGVLRLQTANVTGETVRTGRAIASLLTLYFIAKGNSSDDYVRLKRVQPMELPAEFVWSFLPSRSLGTDGMTSSAFLEPAYSLGGDAFDHCLVGNALNATILDAMGHDVMAGLLAAVALAGCRNTRRSGGNLLDITKVVDRNVGSWFPDRFVTGIFSHLDLDSGVMTWANCGHPPPLLIRRQEIIPEALNRDAELPLGMIAQDNGNGDRRIHQAQLEPGDRVLMFTDGVTEARSGAGETFGEQRFTDFVIEATAAGEAAPEVLRRFTHSLLDYQHGNLTDDATTLLFEWHPDAPHAEVPIPN